MPKYIAFLRGINVGGHHKLPMADLKTEMKNMGFENPITLLNSGNVLFEGEEEGVMSLQKRMEEHLSKCFSFPVPTIIRTYEALKKISDLDPFKGIEVHKDIRLYVSFLQEDVETKTNLPYSSEDGSYRILDKIEDQLFSVLDVSVTGTPKAMEILEKTYGKGITTRNWNTVIKLIEKGKI